MREVVSLHLGQAGVQSGLSCWELFTLEQNLNYDGTINTNANNPSSNINDPESAYSSAFFSTVDRTSKFVPRCIMMDLDPSVIDSVSFSFIFGRRFEKYWELY